MESLWKTRVWCQRVPVVCAEPGRAGGLRAAGAAGWAVPMAGHGSARPPPCHEPAAHPVCVLCTWHFSCSEMVKLILVGLLLHKVLTSHFCLFQQSLRGQGIYWRSLRSKTKLPLDLIWQQCLERHSWGGRRKEFDIFSSAWVSILTILWNVSYLLDMYFGCGNEQVPRSGWEAPAAPSTCVQVRGPSSASPHCCQACAECFPL